MQKFQQTELISKENILDIFKYENAELDLLMFRTGKVLGKKYFNNNWTNYSYLFLFYSEREASERKKNEEKSRDKPSSDTKVIS